MPSRKSSSPSANENRAYRGKPNASPGTNATLARSSTTSASSRVVAAVMPLRSRFSNPEKSGKQ
ncbi:unannotated protein [freshwater metagenome]|uniref:Unannotated protein n=1 Tax=freshwater metagenome TaxID=449393 RepID=A0A6J6L8M3_9ZZZZ